MKASQKPRSSKRPSRRPKPSPKRKLKPRSASSTADILGGSSAQSARPKVKPKWARHYRHLLELRTQLLAQSGKLARDATEALPTYSMHMADAGTDSFDRDFALSMLSSDQDALFEIEAALTRIQTASYGICELTGKPIPQGRLDAIPWTRFCADAQRQLERDGNAKKRQLSAFGSVPAVETTEPAENEEGTAPTTEKD